MNQAKEMLPVQRETELQNFGWSTTTIADELKRVAARMNERA